MKNISPCELALAVVLGLCACANPALEDSSVTGLGGGLQGGLAAAGQRTGDAARGRSLLLNNGTPETPYLSCGIPKGLVDSLAWLGVDVLGPGPKLPDRERGNAELPYTFSHARTRAGVDVVTTNCLLCHASQLGDALVVGLGNPNLDFTGKTSGAFGLPPIAEELLRLAVSEKERVELDRFSRLSRASEELAQADTVGVNPADAMFGVLAAHRDATTLQWRNEKDPNARLDVDLVFTDVPRGGTCTVATACSTRASGAAITRAS